MAGQMGNRQKTTIGLQVIEVDENKNLIYLKGAVPGANNGFLAIEKTGRVKNYEDKLEEDIQKEEKPNITKDTSEESAQVNKQETEIKTENKKDDTKDNINKQKGNEDAKDKG